MSFRVDDGARRRKGGRRGEYKVKQEGRIEWVCGGRVDREVQGTWWFVGYVCGRNFLFLAWTLALAWSGGDPISRCSIKMEVTALVLSTL